MKASEVRKRYIDFFVERGHRQIPAAPLVLPDDPTTLFTSSGMQPLVPYLMGEPYPAGKRLVDSQPSIRTVDIDEVGDNRHLTFFEMLGNWSLGDYFKKEQLAWIFEFFTKELSLPAERLWVSVFEGNNQVPKDQESVEVWEKLGIPEKRICYYGVEKNWWSRSGTPVQMPVGEIGGPDSEVFFEFTQVKHDSRYGKTCHPNCDCGRFLEIGNSVFMQYKKVGDNKLEELPNKNVDFGGGLERITAVVNNTPDVFATDLFKPVIKSLEELFKVNYGDSEENDRSLRIIADHLRAAYMLIANDVLSSNKTQGYVLRRLIRRSVLHVRLLTKSDRLGLPVVEFGSFGIPIRLKDTNGVGSIIQEEAGKFVKALGRGMKKLEEAVSKKEKITGDFVFDLYQTDGFPLEISLEVLERHGREFTEEDKKLFEEDFEKHKETSRTTSAGVFKGGLADHSAEVIKLHTATHLLLASLRKVLGEHVVQKGQNITRERARFDFPNPEKLTDEQIKKVEGMVNEVIKKDLPVNFKVMVKEEAEKTGAIHAFGEKYADTVKVYYVGENFDTAFSKEFCGGPHVSSTGKIGGVRIKKVETIGVNLRRMYVVLDG
ncbi:hypothetical protein A3A66_02980 [Microgenomates group bacterium RIFCSPLOWO2_01_FULL_46_13]|nr:MAG: hypothetical protein A2783_05255 [Microgenomates group bacterium RIFCSPHIGHO2_01_FULL_45_11]OGV95135.1 MAG: hypothetical protein A3A66_02980 [Microgenomates group bacterium RIFCSPLOWO2_01_FULL_46_13]